MGFARFGVLLDALRSARFGAICAAFFWGILLWVPACVLPSGGSADLARARGLLEAIRAEEGGTEAGPVEARVEGELGIDLYCGHDEELAGRVGLWLEILRRELSSESVAGLREVFLVEDLEEMRAVATDGYLAGFLVASSVVMETFFARLGLFAHEVGHHLLLGTGGPRVLTGVEWAEPALDARGGHRTGGVFLTPYSGTDQTEWACETYAAFLQATYELGGPLVDASRASLDRVALAAFVSACRREGWIRAESAGFLRRYIADPSFAETVRRLAVCLGNAEIPAGAHWISSRHHRGARSGWPAYPWAPSPPPGPSPPAAFDLLACDLPALSSLGGDFMEHFEARASALRALCGLLELGGVPAAPLLNESERLWHSGDDASARAHLAASVTRAVRSILDPVPAVGPGGGFAAGAESWGWSDDAAGLFAGLAPLLAPLPPELKTEAPAGRHAWLIAALGIE